MTDDMLNRIAAAHHASGDKLCFTYFRTILLVHLCPDYADDPVAIIYDNVVHYPIGKRDLVEPNHRTLLANLAMEIQ